MNDTLLTLPERLNRLKQHLLLAGEFGRAAILLVVYRSEFKRTEAEQALQTELEAAGQQVVKVRVVAGQATSDLAVYLGEHPASGQAVFFVYDVGQGGQETLQFLNYRREMFVAQKERLVLWLTEQIFTQLAREAPDFFAFRGRTLEFLEAPSPTELKGLSEQLTYYDWDGEGRQSREAREVGIRLRENLLAELPTTAEFNEQRAELLYALANEYQQLNQPERALSLYQKVAQLVDAENSLYVRLQNSLGNAYHDLGRYEEAIATYHQTTILDSQLAAPHNGLGNVYYALRQYDKAISSYQQAIALDGQLASPYQGLGNVYYVLGQYEDAMIAYQQAMALDPQDAAPQNGLANVYRALRRYDEAIAAYQQAIEIYPHRAGYHSNLGNVYYVLGKYNEAITAYLQSLALEEQGNLHVTLAGLYREIGDEAGYEKHVRLARALMTRESAYNRACFEAVVGNDEVALVLLAQALEKKQVTRDWARKDPDLASLRDDPRFLALVGDGEGDVKNEM